MHPALKCRKSDSIPSEKITPFSGICDSSCNVIVLSTAPNISDVPDLRPGNGSRTLYCTRFSFQPIPPRGGCELPPVPPRPPARTDCSHPVEPSPVEIITPEED